MKPSLSELLEYIRTLYPSQNPIPLHAPVFLGREKQYLADCIDSTFVSYVGKYVTQFEEMTARYVGAKYAIAVVNGTAALQIALQVAGVERGDEVITQALTFAATANAIVHAGGQPVFVDVDFDTMGMSPDKLADWLKKNTVMDAKTGQAVNRSTRRKIGAIVPMHTFGHPCRIEDIRRVADAYHIPLVEDAAESLGSFYKGKHTGTFGLAAILSYNGNKTVTTGGGGMIITDDDDFARKARHLTTTAKVPHPWEFVHDEVGYNYRMPNINAAVGTAQMEKLPEILANKRETALGYAGFCDQRDIHFFKEPGQSTSNYWLNAILLSSRQERDQFLEVSNKQGVMTRPIWRLMPDLAMYQDCQRDDLTNSVQLESLVVNIPSSVRGTKS